jgi:adenylosuccinate synthase
MASTCVVGLQWGDEAKGKVVDLLTREHDVVVRFNGGANAGHTVMVGEQVYKLSLIPSGIVHPGLTCVMGNGLAIHPPTLMKEMDALVERGLEVDGRILISDRAHVIFPYHMEEERLLEEGAAERAIGTTRRGIGPCYADKAGRLFSIRVGELLDTERLRERLRQIVPHKNRILEAMSPSAARFDAEELTREYTQYAKRLAPYVTDTFWYLQQALRDRKNILFEAAQGSLLDLDHGSFPYVTSSNSSACGLQSGCGIPPRRIDRFVGIVKAYTTRVGGGPFPTELHDAIGDHIRTAGKEFGTVTGRPRRCGWLDAVALRYTALLNGVDSIAVMLLDVLSQLDEIKLCEAYEIEGERTNEFAVPLDKLAKCKPVYRTFPGWKRDISCCRNVADLPNEARSYIDAITQYLQIPVKLCSVGPERDQTVIFD